MENRSIEKILLDLKRLIQQVPEDSLSLDDEGNAFLDRLEEIEQDIDSKECSFSG